MPRTPFDMTVNTDTHLQNAALRQVVACRSPSHYDRFAAERRAAISLKRTIKQTDC